MEQFEYYFSRVLSWLGKALLVAMAVVAVRAWVLVLEMLEATGWSVLWAVPITVFAFGVIIETLKLAEHFWSNRPSEVARSKALLKAYTHAEWVAGHPAGFAQHLKKARLDAQPNDIGRGDKS